MHKITLRMTLVSLLALTHNMACSTKNDDGLHESTQSAEVAANQKVFRTSTGECTPDFQNDLVNESLYAKLQALKDQVLSQPEVDPETIAILAAEAQNACDVILGTYAVGAQTDDVSQEMGETLPVDLTCDVLGAENAVHKTYSLADIQARCEQASKFNP